jgi:hypothetical protein
MEDAMTGFFVSTVIGLISFSFGLAGRLGYVKSIFIHKGIPGVYPKNIGYALMPLGIFFLSFYPIYLWAG